MTVYLHIDRLVLDGLAPLDGDAVGAAVQAELSRLVAEAGVPGLDGSARRAVLDGGALDLSGDTERVGRDLARHLHTTLMHQLATP